MKENIKKRFISDLIEELNNSNERLLEDNKRPIMVADIVAVIDQQIEKCEEFIEDLKNGYCIHGYEEDISEGYTNGKIRVLIEESDDEYEYKDYCYYIEFLDDHRSWGYCQCTPEQEGYNIEYDCCGDGCDFDAPAFRITKEIYMGWYTWDGLEKDLWAYEEQFNANENNKSSIVEEMLKQQEKERLEEQLLDIQEKLDKFNN